MQSSCVIDRAVELCDRAGRFMILLEFGDSFVKRHFVGYKLVLVIEIAVDHLICKASET